DVAVLEVAQNRGQRPFAPNGVSIQARNPSRREHPLDLRLHPFGAEARLLHERTRAQGTRRRHWRRVAAIMAARTTGSPLTMDDQCDAAVDTVEGSAALPAE